MGRGQTPHSGQSVSRSLIFYDAAIADIDDAFNWYEKQRSGLGGLFMAELEHKKEQITDNPALFPKVRGDICRALLYKFPYSIFFFAQPELIGVVAVLHHSRNPIHWQKRLISN